jgi:hypothetical protein
MTTAVNNVLASCHRLLLGRPLLAVASPPAAAEQSQTGFDADGCGAGLAGPAFRFAQYPQGASDGTCRAPRWG